MNNSNKSQDQEGATSTKSCIWYYLKSSVSNTKLQDLQRNTQVIPVHQGKGRQHQM